MAKQKTREDSEYSWTIDAANLGDDLDLSVKNPHKIEEVDERTPTEIYDNILALAADALELIQEGIGCDLWPSDDPDDDLFAEPEGGENKA